MNQTKTNQKPKGLSLSKANKIEIGWVLGLSLFVALFAMLGGLAGYNPDSNFVISGFKLSKDMLYFGFLTSLGVVPGFLILAQIVNPSKETPKFTRGLNVAGWLLFSVCGILAYMVLVAILVQYCYFPVVLGHFVTAFVVCVYEYLVLKLYAYQRIESTAIGWEIFRFGLVGIVATIADFLCTSMTRMALTPTGLNEFVVTFIAVTIGFAVGVVVNYFLSVYMVYKATKSKASKTWWGIILFIVMSAVGLGIGIGMESLFYNHLQWPYILVFLFRTAVVLVWNYLSRKFVLFK